MAHSGTGPRLILVGPPGAGKTTVGELVAATLGVPLCDSDAEVERLAGTTVPEIFRTRGESEFRVLEHDAVTRLLSEHDGVLALGGGAVLHPGTQAALAGHHVVFLDVDADHAVARVARSGARPLLEGDPAARFEALMTARRPVYERVATARVGTGGRTAEDVAADVLRTLVAPASSSAPATSPAPAAPQAPASSAEPAPGPAPASAPAPTAPAAPATRITVTGAAPYDVVVGHGLDGEVLDLVGPDASRVLLVHPAALAGRAEALRAELAAAGRTALTHEVPDAESAKTLDVVAGCWDLLGERRFGRDDAVVALGGGATTDMAGFVAATWLRGIRLVNVPTTLLGMVDAAVGGKTGINTAAGKNLVGSFHPPAGVVCDLDSLGTLPAVDLRAGLAEVVKCGFIADEEILRLVEADGGAAALRPGSPVLRELVERAVAVKARVVGADLREAGLREILNYGHTFAHAIERTEGYTWRHGDAVAVGMVFAAELARAAGHLDETDVRRHRGVLEALGLPTAYGEDRWPDLLDAMASDKKVRGSTLRFVVLDAVGRPTILRGPAPEQLEAAWAAVRG
ncbi:3-dehydroquinate synthase [Georgenia muralis]